MTERTYRTYRKLFFNERWFSSLEKQPPQQEVLIYGTWSGNVDLKYYDIRIFSKDDMPDCLFFWLDVPNYIGWERNNTMPINKFILASNGCGVDIIINTGDFILDYVGTEISVNNFEYWSYLPREPKIIIRG